MTLARLLILYRLRFRLLRAHAEGGLGTVSITLDEERHREVAFEVAFKEIKSHYAQRDQARTRLTGRSRPGCPMTLRLPQKFRLSGMSPWHSPGLPARCCRWGGVTQPSISCRRRSRFRNDCSKSTRTMNTSRGTSPWHSVVMVRSSCICNVHLQRADDAIDAYQESLDLRQVIIEENPGDFSAMRDEGVRLNHLGKAFLSQRRFDDALPVFEQDPKITQRIAEADPNNTQVQRDLYDRCC